MRESTPHPVPFPPVRVLAVLGPQGSGKTTLVQQLLKAWPSPSSPAAPLPQRQQNLGFEGFFETRIFASPEVVLLDCPGQPENLEESLAMASIADLALVVVGSNPKEFGSFAPVLARLSHHGVPHAIVINKIETHDLNIDAWQSALKESCSESPLWQQFPVFQKEEPGPVAGLVKLWDPKAPLAQPPHVSGSNSAEDPPGLDTARQLLWESVAEHDDALLATLLEEQLPTLHVLMDDLRSGLQKDEIVPVFLTSATSGLGVSQVAEMLNTLVTFRGATLTETLPENMGLEKSTPSAVVLLNGEMRQRSRALCCRLLAGDLAQGMRWGQQKLSDIFVFGSRGQLESKPSVRCGSVFVSATSHPEARGTVLTAEEHKAEEDLSHFPLMTLDNALYAQAVVYDPSATATDKLLQALDVLSLENPAVARSFGETPEHELLVWTPGPVVAAEVQRLLSSRFDLNVHFRDPAVPHRERLATSHERVHGRFKHQNGGHGAFGDVLLNFHPLPPDSGIQFEDRLVGGSIPKSFVPAIEAGIREALQTGVTGAPLTDLLVTLVDGTTHPVDSSEFAFRQAARLAVQRMLETAQIEVLEPRMDLRVTLADAHASAVLKTLNLMHASVREILPTPCERGSHWTDIDCQLLVAQLPGFLRNVRSLCHGNVLFENLHPSNSTLGSAWSKALL